MRPNVKTRWVYASLLSQIRSGNQTQDLKLPNERALAEQFHVSRDTVRSALAILEMDGVIERRRKTGTCSLNKGKQGTTITFLLACQTLECSGMMWYLVRNMIQALRQECHRNGSHLELLPVSPTNNINDIDDQALSYLNADSRIFVYGEWFLPLLPRLIKTGAHILYLTTCDVAKPSVREELLSMPGNVRFLVPDIRHLYYEAVAHLADQGCRRIACFIPQKYGEGQMLQGYEEGIQAFTGGVSLFKDCSSVMKELHSFEELARFLNQWRKETDYDGLLYSCDMEHFCEEYRLFSYESLHLPTSVKVVMTHLIPYQAMVKPQFPVLEFEHRIPQIVVDLLLHPQESPRIRFMEPHWIIDN